MGDWGGAERGVVEEGRDDREMEWSRRENAARKRRAIAEGGRWMGCKAWMRDHQERWKDEKYVTGNSSKCDE